MTSDIQAFHFFWVGLFAALGTVLLLKSRVFMSVIPRFDDLDFETEADRERVISAAKRREQLEQAARWKSLLPGLLALFYAALSAFAQPAEQAMLWAMFCLASAAVLASMYLKLRSNNPVKVAALNVRSPLTVIPPIWLAVTCAIALSVLVEIDQPQMMMPSIVTCIATLACVALAWRVANVRAILSGEDLAAERFVDERLRVSRAGAVLVFALVQAELFLVMSDLHWESGPASAAKIAAMAAIVGYIVWKRRLHEKGPSELPA